MARKKTPTARVDVKARISERLRSLRQELFGDHGGPELARRLNLPARTWYNYESGVTVPAEVLLSFIDETGADPSWLLTGRGPRFRRPESTCGGAFESPYEDVTPEILIRRSLEILANEHRDPFDSEEAMPGHRVTDHVALDLVPMSHLCGPQLDRPAEIGRVSVDRRWIPHPASTIATRLEDEAMRPILPEGSIVAIDRTRVDPLALSGRIVAACVGGQALIRWLEVSDRHVILRPNLPGREHPLVPIGIAERTREWFLGSVVWSWSRFGAETGS